jgi:hypothetical protein
MKKLLFILLLLSTMALSQSTPIEEYFYHYGPTVLSTTFTTNVASYSYVMQFSGRGGPVITGLTDIDLVASTAAIPALGNTNIDAKFNGYLGGDILFTNVSGTDPLDSVWVQIWPIDKYGYVPSNDYVYLTLGVPPSFSTTSTKLDLVSGTVYKFDLSGAFGVGTYGFLIKFIDVNLDSPTNTNTLRLRVYNN